MPRLAEFSADLSKLALADLSAGFATLVQRFRDNSELAELVGEVGISQAVASDNSAFADLQKKNKEFVTAAERSAEMTMRERVASVYPSHAIVGEEFGASQGDEWLWVFDPVDGTSAMIRTAMAHAYGVELATPAPAFGITIAVVHGDDAVLGLVGELRPADDGLVMPRVWVGGRGLPTTCDGRPASVKPAVSLAEATLASTVPEVMFTTAETWGGFQALLDSTAAFQPDQNCIGFTRVIDGSVDIVMESDLTLPDAAALIPVLEGAGVTITDHAGSPVRFDTQARGGEYSLLAAAPGLHSEALAAVRAGVPTSENRFVQGEQAHHGYAKKFPQS